MAVKDLKPWPTGTPVVGQVDIFEALKQPSELETLRARVAELEAQVADLEGLLSRIE